MSVRRQTVWWVGQETWPQGLNDRFVERDLTLISPDGQVRTSMLGSARAIIFSDPDDKVLEELTSGLIAKCLAHGLRVIVVGAPGRAGEIAMRLREVPYFASIQVIAPNRVPELAEQCARFDPGPTFATPAELKIRGFPQTGSPEDEILLRRAFADCTDLELRRMDSGTASVFQGFATLRDSRAGPVPLPFFIKLDRFPKAKKELDNYGACTALFVPFDARPNIDPKRCLLGAERGVIVGNFVERSEPLISVVERSSSYCPAVDSLFNHALRGWRAQAHWARQNSPVQPLEADGAIRTFREERFVRRAAECEAESKRLCGLSLTAAEIGALFDGLPPLQHRRALSHGDLHGENVVVVDGRAVLIDFVNVAEGPLVRDPAALETWLFLKIKAEEAEWARTAYDLYSAQNLLTLPLQRAPTHPLSGVWNVIRQIRQFGLAEQISHGEYAQAVGIQLLRHTLRRDSDEQPHRRPTFMKLSADVAQALVKLAHQRPAHA